MPFPQARIHLDQLVQAVARIVLELDLRDAVEAKRAQELQRVVGKRRSPARFRDACSPDLARRLPELPSGEEAELLAVARQIGADRPQRVVVAGYPLLRERTKLACVLEPLLDLR